MNFESLKELDLAQQIAAISAANSWECTLQINCNAINKALEAMGSNRRLGFAHGYQNLGMANHTAKSEYFWFCKGDNLYDHRNTHYLIVENWKDALIKVLSA
jgi:hypothetical protein